MEIIDTGQTFLRIMNYQGLRNNQEMCTNFSSLEHKFKLKFKMSNFRDSN
jgi:hypothetical protein